MPVLRQSIGDVDVRMNGMEMAMEIREPRRWGSMAGWIRRIQRWNPWNLMSVRR